MTPSDSSISSRIVAAIGLVLTVILFSGYRPWGPSPLYSALLLGPVLLGVGLAGNAVRSQKRQAAKSLATPATRVLVIGLVMLLVGGCPWIYTPLFSGGESNQASGMLGTIIFILIGLPGVAVTLVGLTSYARERRARRRAGDG